MATTVLNDVKLWRGAYDLSGKSNTLRAGFTTEALDDTGFGNSGRAFVPGLNGATLDHAGMADLGAGSYEDILYAEHGDTDLPITVAVPGAAGDRAYLFQGIPSQLTLGGSVGELYGFTVTAQGSGSIGRGLVLEGGVTARTVTFNGTAYQLDAGPITGQFLYATLHVLSASAGDTLDVVIESDDNSGMTTATPRITFTQAAAAGSEWKSLAGPVTDDWYRIAVTIAGTDPSFLFAVAVGVGR
jgi:hypothetical protein